MTMMLAMRAGVIASGFVLSLLAAAPASAQPAIQEIPQADEAPAHPAEGAPAADVLRGTWMATAGKRVLGGRWSAQVQPATPNDAVGSWTLVGPKGEVLLQGTWAARKDPKRWSGSWSARVENSEHIYSGTWQAAPAGLAGKTFADMLRTASQHRIGGTWRAGKARGNWWLAEENAGAAGAPAPTPPASP